MKLELFEHNLKAYPSISEAGRSLCNEFHVTNTKEAAMVAILNRLSGRMKNPIYKNQFRFEYANQEPPLKKNLQMQKIYC